MNISELSEKTGVSPRMLRYFEEHGLLSPKRGENQYRQYSPENQKKVLQICEWQRLGLTLKEIKTLLESPEQSEEILSNVFERERSAFLLKKNALSELRGKFRRWDPVVHDRIAYTIRPLDEMASDTKEGVQYRKFRGALEKISGQVTMIGEFVSQSSFYLLMGDDEKALEKRMSLFIRRAHETWKLLDAEPPKLIDKEDMYTFFADNDIVIHLEFEEGHLILPYPPLFALYKSTE